MCLTSWRPLSFPSLRRVDVSPDGRYLLVSWLERPWSFNVPCGRFPKRVQLWRADGSLVGGPVLSWTLSRLGRVVAVTVVEAGQLAGGRPAIGLGN